MGDGRGPGRKTVPMTAYPPAVSEDDRSVEPRAFSRAWGGMSMCASTAQAKIGRWILSTTFRRTRD
eukprot:8734925-Alexandrium_andersonii.AAC.1